VTTGPDPGAVITGGEYLPKEFLGLLDKCASSCPTPDCAGCASRPAARPEWELIDGVGQLPE
jgi:hypothetical protein